MTTSLGATITALTTMPAGAPLQAAIGIAAEHLAWLELTHVDLTDVLATIPDAAIDAVAAHFHDEPSSPFAPLVTTEDRGPHMTPTDARTAPAFDDEPREFGGWLHLIDYSD